MSEEIKTIITIALGEASTCWENLNKAGVFDSTKCVDIANRAYSDVMVQHDAAIVDRCFNSALLQEQNKKLRECVVDMVKVLRAYDSLNIELRNMPGVRKLYDPEIIHYETIEQCLKEIDNE